MVPKKKARPDSDRRLRQNSRLARILRVLQLIQGRGRWNAKEIARELECGERTVYRDLQALEMAGVPWSYDEAAHSYRVQSGWQFPVVNLTPDELLGQVVATTAANAPGLKVGEGAKATTQKLAGTLSEQSRQLIADAEQLVAVLDLKLADHSRSRDVIHTVQWALLERKQVSGLYASPYQAKPIRVQLHPYRLCLVQNAWYLIGRPAGEDAPKTYRVARFHSLRKLDRPADVPQDFSLRDYFGNAWAVFRGSPRYDIEILFTADAAVQVTETQWHATQQAERHADGSVTLKFCIDGLEEILWWLLGWSGFATVVKPAELRTMVVSQLRDGQALNELQNNTRSGQWKC